MPDSGLGAARERLGDNRAMALGVVTLIAQQRDGACGGSSQGVKERALRGEILAKITEEAREIAILA